MGTSVIYKVTYPNGQTYVGQDRTNSLTFFGSQKAEFVVRISHQSSVSGSQ